tara:strand:+ start:760 stop:957 length:198 start_codon:yes stop_codon:yes gene_type:complete
MKYMTVPVLTNNNKFKMNVYENRALVETKVSASLPSLLNLRSKNDSSDKVFSRVSWKTPMPEGWE